MTATVLPYDDLVWACTNLCELLSFENQALSAHDVQSVREIAENKQALARIYEQAVQPMAEDPSLVDALEPEQRQELAELGQLLKEIVEKNAMLLKAEVAACESLMSAMVSAVKQNSTKTMTYGKSGVLGANPATDINSISLNDTF